MRAVQTVNMIGDLVDKYYESGNWNSSVMREDPLWRMNKRADPAFRLGDMPIDFNALERRVLGMDLVWPDRIPLKKEVQIATPVAPLSPVARVRKEKEDRMLRLRAKHDHPAHIKGVRRALL